MTHRDIVVIGASAGGVEALSRLVAGLPAGFPAAVFVTMHFPRTSQSVLPRILSRAGPLEAVHPADDDRIVPGRIHVAPPDRHLLLADGHVRLVRGPTENGNRPAVDPMFRSAAVAYGPRVIGVVLSGNLDDGTAGLYAVNRRGGIGIAQDPGDALFPSMPMNAISHGLVQHVSRLEDIAPLLQRLVAEEITLSPELPMRDDAPDDAQRETRFAGFDLAAIQDSAHHTGRPSPYSCPDCGGVLWEIEDGEMLRFRCRVGHGWTTDGLLGQQTGTLDAALWTALRALEENAGLNHRLARRATERGDHARAERLTAQAQTAERQSGVIRDALVRENGVLTKDAGRKAAETG